ncbi:MAG: acetyl-CoA carboxylase biotin carboxylase subunit [Acidobacteriota bacterium]|nr:acetyl-CoA carboxylase biotin carboxylase subunit [Acidobacteriota bacterium]MDQ7087266.1 acetyl-CoA carboxylase biotin carboxylase subunit [Acidobacteriota bacterium]
MFRKLLVANRGEVAVRVARTCRKMSVCPVAVFSEADRGAPWLEAFDEAICLGPAHPARSYLDQEAILQAAQQADVQALHPGWGFLAENALFATRVRHQGLAWVGPPPRAIRLMGDKALARRTVASAGLPTIPGSEGTLDDIDQARRLAAEIGYPVLLKATAGGGGKGMRICRDESELAQGFTEASREAEASFSNPGLYLEKFIERGRHIEFQLMADSWGAAVHLGERECSVQRRHQKLVEEAPSPVLDPALRQHYGELVVQAALAVGYEGAGTVEFLREPGGKLYFMEMNTRLQVEHPVTEMISGIDLVEHQLRVAAGERLALRQEEITLDGHAIEARINAEDPSDDFRPSPGEITRFDFPRQVDGARIRVDTHVLRPSEVPPFYDSLVAKVIAWGPSRPAAIAGLSACLAGARIEGVPTTIPAHLKILAHQAFTSGDYDTGTLEDIDLGSPAPHPSD